MKKSIFIGLAAVLGLIGCTRNQEIDIQENGLTLMARTESPADTKTVVEEGVHVYWEPGDEIAVFMGEKSAKFTTDITAASGTATFKGTFGDESWPEELDLWAVYPYSEEAVFDGETITTVLPSEQVAREGSFGKDMNLSIAHSTGTSLQFYNVGGGIRFSVTEEGIKKVMFEGLSGEIISGKVKIGFDENGKQVVKEVTGGSQFITLLPPSGKKSFEPGMWYYIVAIPGALEGGYKLRFYKDSDYARRVSEKRVEIKRSIFGSLEKADMGIEYEATTTHYPETKEEWEESNYLTERIADDVRHVFYDLLSTSSNNTIDSERFVSEVTNIEGVADYSLIGTDEGIVIVQTDGIHINIIYDYLYSRNDSNPEASNETHNISTKAKSVTIPNTGTKTAALFSPFQNHNIGIKDPIRINVSNLGTSLAGIGYDLKYYPDFETTLNELTPDKLSKYDLVFFVTHGHYKHGIKDQKGKVLETLLTTGQKVGTIDFSLEENIHLANAAIFLCDDGVYYSITPLWLMGIENSVGHRASYNNSIIFALACNSFVNNDFADYFTDRGAAVYVGDKYMINGEDSIIAVDGLIKYLAMGASVRKSTELIKKEFSFWGRVFYPLEVSEELQGVTYLIDPTPINLKNTEIRDSRTTLLWEQSKNTGEYKFQVHIKWPNSNSYTTYNSTNSKAYTTDALQPGEYSWYVEANLYYDGKVVETFISDTKSFTVTEETTGNNVIYYTSTDGQIVTLQNYGFGAQIVSHDYLNGRGVITFDGEVTKIPERAFHQCSTLASITIPETVTSLGRYSFYGCSNLQSITIPKAVTSLGNHCFDNCSSLNSLTIPESVTSMAEYCFYQCSNLVSIAIYGDITEFSRGCFSGCSSLSSINLPQSLISIGDFCFDSCSSLISVSLPESLTEIGSHCFNNCSSLASITIPQSVTSIGGWCFRSCTSLVSVQLPHSLTNLSDGLFQGCTSLSSFTIPESVTSLGGGCFSVCSSLTSINIPGSVTSLGTGCFTQCSNLTAVTIPGSVIIIGDQCFRFCTSLISITIPQGVTSLGEECFAYSSNLKSVIIPESVSELGVGCFNGCSSLSRVTIPAAITKLNDYCFDGCRSLTAIVIPEAVTSIGEGCFSRCSGLTSLTIPESVESLGGWCFNSCSGLVSVFMKSTVPPTGSQCMFQDTNHCIFYVPEESYYEYKSAPFWNDYSFRFQVYERPNPDDVGIDLGLSVNWSAYNLGAWIPEEYGEYYAWGETSTKQSFTWGNYKLCNGSIDSIAKYTYDDQLTTLDWHEDAAVNNLNWNWRMPTKEEWQELLDNCTWERHTRNGVDGMLATSTVPGYTSAHLFFPFAGRKDGGAVVDQGLRGQYWTSSLSPFESTAWIGTVGNTEMGYSDRYLGYPIRPVYDE